MRIYFFIHIIAWVILIGFGISEQVKGRSRLPVYVGMGMYRGGYYPIVSAAFVGAIPIVNVFFVLWMAYEYLKENEKIVTPL